MIPYDNLHIFLMAKNLNSLYLVKTFAINVAISIILSKQLNLNDDFRCKCFKLEFPAKWRLNIWLSMYLQYLSRSLKFNDPLMLVKDNTQNNSWQIDKV
jgi:hypothetical protein